MANTSIDGFSVLSPSQKKELERQRKEKEAQEAARKAEEERKSQEAARKAEEEAAKRRAEAERKAAAAKKAREAKKAKKRKGSIISLLVCLSLTALMVGLFYILHVYDLDVLNLLYVPLAIFLGLPIVWGGIYSEIKDNF